MSKINYVLYVSQMSLRVLLSTSAINDIEVLSKKNNIDHGISGFICHGNQYFLHYLEGSPAAIQDLCERLAHDKRHYNMYVLAEGHREARLFRDWAQFIIPFNQFLTYYSEAYIYMPFEPYDWSPSQAEIFIGMFKDFYDHYDGNKKLIKNGHTISNNSRSLIRNRININLNIPMFTSVMLLILLLNLGLLLYIISKNLDKLPF